MGDFLIFHNSHDVFYRKPFGAVKCGSKISIKIKACGANNVILRLIDFNYKEKDMIMYKEGDTSGFSTDIELNEAGIVNYYFIVDIKGHKVFYGNSEGLYGGEGQIYNENPKGFQITVYKDFKVPSWYKEGIMYQIFVDSFFNGNDNNEVVNKKKNSFIYGTWDDAPMYIKDKEGDILRWSFYGGNLKGIIKKLQYLKSLGVTVIYLNPIFEASSVHKYDTGNYLKIDPMFGDDETFNELCKAAKDIGIKIILDGVFSHTGDDSVYFNKYGNYDSVGAYQSSESPYYSWYRFKSYPFEYESWWGVKTLPNVEELNKSYINFIIDDENSVIGKWMKLGASGWRLDVADELPDQFIEKVKTRIKKENKDGILIGEVWEDASNKISYNKRRKYLLGEELDSVMNYPFRDVVINFLSENVSSELVKNITMSLKENYPEEVFKSNMNMIGTHDTKRLLTVFEERVHNYNIAKKLLKLAALIQMTFPGIPCIYYGDEAGVTGGKDPYNRSGYPWGKEDYEILDYYKKLTSIRSFSDALKKGDIEFFHSKEDILIFKREYNLEKVVVIVNRNPNSTIEVDINGENFILKDLITDKIMDKYAENGFVKIEPLSGQIFINNNQ